MKKLIGWIIIIICSVLLLSFAITLIALLGGTIKDNSNVPMSTKEILSTVFGFLIVVALLIIGLKNGIKKVRKEKVLEIIEYNEELNISLSGQIEYRDYRSLIFGLTFKKPVFFIVFGILILFTLTFLMNKESVTSQIDSSYFIFILLGAFILSPVFTLIQIKKLYQTNKIFQERLDYQLNNDSLEIKGETVNSTQNWTHFYKLRETKNFFMFYQGKMIATLIDKKMFTDNDLEDFKSFVKSLNIKRY